EVGEAGVHRRAEEARGDPSEEREQNDLKGCPRERKDEEDAGPRSVREHKDPAARSPVEKPPREEPDDDAREELGHEQRADPGGVLGAIVDVDDQRNECEPGADARGKRREEKEAESSGLPQEPEPGSP